MTECNRCGDYAYYPVNLCTVPNAEVESIRGMLIMPDGWEHIDSLCRKCAAKLDKFMQGEFIQGDDE